MKISPWRVPMKSKRKLVLSEEFETFLTLEGYDQLTQGLKASKVLMEFD